MTHSVLNILCSNLKGLEVCKLCNPKRIVREIINLRKFEQIENELVFENRSIWSDKSGGGICTNHGRSQWILLNGNAVVGELIVLLVLLVLTL